jgi:hypothetical protein
VLHALQTVCVTSCRLTLHCPVSKISLRAVVAVDPGLPVLSAIRYYTIEQTAAYVQVSPTGRYGARMTGVEQFSLGGAARFCIAGGNTEG